MQHGTVPDKMGIGKEEGCCFLWENVLRSTARPVLGLSGLLQRCCLVMKDQTGTRHLWDRSEGFQATSSRSSDPAAHPALQQDSGKTVGDLQLCNLLSPVRLSWRTVVTAVPPLRQQLRSILRWQCLEQTAPSFISFIATVPLLLRDSLQCPPFQCRLSFPVLLFYTPSPAERSRAVPARPAPAGNGSDERWRRLPPQRTLAAPKAALAPAEAAEAPARCPVPQPERPEGPHTRTETRTFPRG